MDNILTPMRHTTDRQKIVGRLTDIANARVDLAANLSTLRYKPGNDRVSITSSGEPFLLPTGVANHLLADVNRTAWVQLCEKLDFPLRYADRLRAGEPESWQRDLLRENIRGLAANDSRAGLFRLLQVDGQYTLRALLSDRYDIIDDTDALVAVTRGLAEADIGLGDCEVEADWSMDRFRLRIAVPAIFELAPDLLADYRAPYSMLPNRGVHDRPEPGETLPVLWAGLEISNSETGGGALTVVPRIVVLACRNGMTRTQDIVRKIHAGSTRLERGVVEWSQETRRKSLDLVSSMIADAAKTFCSVEYLRKATDEMRVAKGMTVESPLNAINKMAEVLTFTETEKNSAFAAFIAGGDTTVLGLGQAVTAMAQTVEASDRQAELEAAFWDVVGPLAKTLATA